MFFKGKDYKKAISKYCRINLYLKIILSQAGGATGGDDQALAMLQNRQKTTLTDAEIQSCKEL